jgi:hypothetical protein
MNKPDTSANDQLGINLVNVWPPVSGSRTLSDYAAEAKLHRTQAFMAAFKYLFNRHSLGEFWNGVDDSGWLGSLKTTVGLHNAQH